MEGKQQNISLLGIARNSPGNVCPDGELDELINARYKNGTFRPIPPRKVLAQGLAYKPIYIHSNAGYSHLLGVRTTPSSDTTYPYRGAWSGSTTYTINQAVLYNEEYFYLSAGTALGNPPGYGNWVKVIGETEIVGANLIKPIPAFTGLYYFADKTGESITPLGEEKLICEINGVTTFTQVGNVVNLLDGSGLSYAVWYESKYVFISSDFDGLQNAGELLGRVDFMSENIYEDDLGILVSHYRKIYSEGIEYANFASFISNENKELRKEAFKGLATKLFSTLRSDGFPIFNFMVISAIELYDGTYILHSNPVLVCQANDINTRYEGLNIGGEICDYKTNKALFIVNGSYVSGEGDNTIEKESSVSNGYAVKNSTLIAVHAYPGNIGASKYMWIETNYKNVDVSASAYLSRLKFRINSNIKAEYKTLIKSISIFISPEVSGYDLDKVLSINETFKYSPTEQSTYLENYSFELKTNAELIKELSDNQLFYKVHEIPFEEIVAGDWVTIDLKGKLGDNLVLQERLPIDVFTHHATKPAQQFTYNSKLHIIDYTTLLSRGFPYSYFYQLAGLGQFQGNLSNTSSMQVDVYIETLIKTNTGTSTVVRSLSYSPPFDWSTTLMPFISYPDSRATKMNIYIKKTFTDDGTVFITKASVDLKASDNGGFAYYISPDLKPFIPDGVEIPAEEFTPPTEIGRAQIFSNALKVSEINNPFYFPADTTYLIGNGQIRALASNSIAISTGQFGEYPLLVFCSDGLYAGYVGGGDITYSAFKPLARDVCNNPQSVKAVDGGVVFSTDRGLMVISGSQVIEISKILRGDVSGYADPGNAGYLDMFYKAMSNNALVQLLPCVSTSDISEYAKEAIVGYNHEDKEIWLTNPTAPYSLLYADGRWYKAGTVGVQFVGDYPREYLLNGDGDLLDIGSDTEEPVDVAFLTRPIKFGTQGLKQSTRAVVRCLLDTFAGSTETPVDKFAGVYIFGSNNGVMWSFLGGTEQKGLRRDIGATVELVDCKYFKVGFVGNLLPGSSIEYITMTAEAKLNNKVR